MSTQISFNLVISSMQFKLAGFSATSLYVTTTVCSEFTPKMRQELLAPIQPMNHSLPLRSRLEYLCWPGPHLRNVPPYCLKHPTSNRKSVIQGRDGQSPKQGGSPFEQAIGVLIAAYQNHAPRRSYDAHALLSGWRLRRTNDDPHTLSPDPGAWMRSQGVFGHQFLYTQDQWGRFWTSSCKIQASHQTFGCINRSDPAIYAVISVSTVQRSMEYKYLVNSRRTRLKSVEHPYSRLFIRIIQGDFLIMFLSRIDWLLPKDHIARKSLWVCNGNQRAAAGRTA